MRAVPFGPGPDRSEPFDPMAAARLLGAPVALLATPADLCRVGGHFSEGDIDHPATPVCVAVTHRFDSADPAAPGPGVTVAEVWTRRLRTEPVPPELAALPVEVPGTSVRGHLRPTLRHYQLDSAARHNRALVAQAARQAQEQPHDWALRPVIVDGQDTRWEFVTVRDVAAGEDILAVGGQVGQVLVAVVGPVRLLGDRLALDMIHP